MDLQLLIRGIEGVTQGGISAKDFSIVTKTDEETAKNILNNFVENGIGFFKNGITYFKDGDKLKSALFAINNGASLEDASTLINWKEFEALVLEILYALGFQCTKNMILTKPRMEIDVIGKKLGATVLIDCKHWQRLNNSLLQKVVKKQIERTKFYLKKVKSNVAIPVIVTLHDERVSFIDNVPIVPISQLHSFLENFYGNMDKLNAIKT